MLANRQEVILRLRRTPNPSSQFAAKGQGQGQGPAVHELVASNADDRGVGSGWTEGRESLLAFRCELSPPSMC